MAVGDSARSPTGQQIAYYRKRLTFSNFPVTKTRVFLGTIPKNGHIVALSGGVKTVFNGSSRQLTVGTNGTTANNIAITTDITEATTQGFWVTRGALLNLTQATDVYARMTFNTTAPSAGLIDLALAFVPAEYDQSGNVV